MYAVKKINQRGKLKKPKEGTVYLVSDCVICDHKKSRFFMSNYNRPGDRAMCSKKIHYFIKIVLLKFQMISLK